MTTLDDELSGSENIEMVCTRGKNGLVPYHYIDGCRSRNQVESWQEVDRG